MKHTLYGLVFLCLSVGALTLPTNLEDSKQIPPMEIITEVAVEKSESEIANDSNKTETPMKMEAEMEMKSKPTMETEIKMETLESTDNKTNKDELKETETPSQPLESSTNQKGLQESETEKEKTTAMVPNESPMKKNENGKDWEGVDKQTDSWQDFEDKFSLLEDRLPDLTKEEFMEINKEDSIPLSFLKGFDISRDMINEAKLKEKDFNIKDLTSKPLAKSETPVYITIPIVINSHSTLPISLSIGGQELPLKMTPKDSDEDLAPAPGGQLNKLLHEISTARRPSNRHRSNLRSKIYARNKRHEVFEFKRDLE